MKKIVTVVGARPQFIKAAMVSKALARSPIEEVLVHTGQHYDHKMSGAFFDELGIAEPKYNLGVGSGTHGYQTAEMLKGVERVLLSEKPDALMIYGDTNSTVAAALAAAKLQIPIAHVEAGLRSFDRSMPEEVNRVLADSISAWLFCPTSAAVSNLFNAGIVDGVYHVGDVMYDAALHYKERALRESSIVRKLGLQNKDFILATIHRDFNTDDRVKLTEIISGLAAIDMPVVFPAHPRVVKRINECELYNKFFDNSIIRLIEPVGYLDMVALECAALVIVTDSGGVQKEAYFQQTPCVTIRDNTEWIETVELGWNRLAKADASAIMEAVTLARQGGGCLELNPYGNGKTSEQIISVFEGGGC